MAGQPPPGAATPNTALITALVYDHVGAPTGVVERAMRFVSSVYRSAGITLAWMKCPSWRDRERLVDGCKHPLKSNELVIRLLRPTSTPGIGSAALGVALVGNGDPAYYASVFYERVQQLAEAEEMAPGVALGCAIAHEIGHLLLKSDSHSLAGIMRKRLDRESQHAAERGNLRLLPEEAAQVREEALTRHRRIR